MQIKRWINMIERKKNIITTIPDYRYYGRLTRATGMMLEAIGLQLPLGAICFIERYSNKGANHVRCEVVGFKDNQLFLMPLENIEGILPGAKVYVPGLIDSKVQTLSLPLGKGLLGRVLSSSGLPLDNLPPPKIDHYASLYSPPFNPLFRSSINKVIDVGIRAINGLITVGRGQRMGLFAGSGVGKSMLLGMIARYTKADIIVVGLIGERGREVKDFIENTLNKERIANTVIIVATADISPVLRMQGAVYATRIAEYFRDHGKHVLLIMDSLTRYAMAQREIGLAIGELPTTKGYPPSVFAKLSVLIERAGNGVEGSGSITAFYTVLTEGDDQQDPIADAARAILDGHIVLSRQLAEAGHYPAIDIEVSISRTMSVLVDASHFQQAQQIKRWLASYQRNRDIISVGAYIAGSDQLLDQAIACYPQLENYLRQDVSQCCNYTQSCQQLSKFFTSF